MFLFSVGTDTNSFAGFRACKCLTGFYRTRLFKGCQPCQNDGPGLRCLNDYATLKQGFWWKWYNDTFKGLYRNFTLNLRSSSPSFDSHVVEYPFKMPKPYECPRKKSCLGGLDSSCEDGYKGTLCELCSHGYYKRFQTCKKCPSRAWIAGQLTITTVLLVLLVVFVVWTSIRKTKRSKQRPLVDIILARLKIIIGFYQVTFGLLEAFRRVARFPGCNLKVFGNATTQCPSDCSIALPFSTTQSGRIWKFVRHFGDERFSCIVCIGGLLG